MAYYLVRAKPRWEKLPALRAWLDSNEIAQMRPFGTALDRGLRYARLESPEIAIWEEEDYCRPPLAMERAAVLDDYFIDINVTHVEQEEGWAKIDQLPSLWDGLEEN